MDANNIATAFVSSANQYAVSQTEMSLKQLQRHLEILGCLTSEESNLTFFQNRSLLSSQCITHISNVILDTNTKQPLVSRALTILQNLVKSPALLKSLQSTFHIQSVLSTFLQQYGMNTKDPLVWQCLQIFQDISFNIKIDTVEHHFENFISALFDFIESETSPVVKVSFHILSNLCRNNPKVQSYICSSNLKQTVKKLMRFLNSSVPSTVLYSLSVLSSISPYNHFGSKLWSDEHLMMTFDLIVKMLFCDDVSCAITALDLFTDLAAITKHQSFFAKSPFLMKCLKKISKLLFEASKDRAIIYLKFLLIAGEIPDSLQKVCSVLCVPTSQGKAKTQCFKIHPILIRWSSKDKNATHGLQIITLKIIYRILSYNSGNILYSFEDSIKEIITNILNDLHIPLTTDLSQWEEYLEFNVAVFQILSLQLKSEYSRNCVSQNINIQLCKEIALLMLDKCINDEIICYEQSVDLFLMIVETLSSFSTEQSHEALNEILDNSTAMHCVSYALTSNNRSLVNRSLSLLSQNKGKWPINILEGSLFQRNTCIRKGSSQCSDTDSNYFSSGDIMPPASKKPYLHQTKISEKSIDSLLGKIENGLQIKDLKSSEIMDLYEHKIAMLTLKEQELQSYVDAKTAALQEADRVITQYKCRQADAEAETLRLRSIMKDYECRCEQSSAQLLFAEQKQRKVEGDLLEAYQRIKALEQNFNEQKEMTNTQMNRLTEQKKNTEEEKARLSELLLSKDQEKKMLVAQMQQIEEEVRQKNKALEEALDQKEELLRALDESRKSAEKAKLNAEQKQQHLQKVIEGSQQTIASLEEEHENLINEMNKKSDEYAHQLSDLESERERLTEQLKLRDSKIEDFNESIKRLNESFDEKSKDLRKTEIILQKCKETLEQTEAKHTKLQQDKKILELLCKKYEGSIEEKDNQIQTVTSQLEILQKEHEESENDKSEQIKHLQDELAKHEYITGMIHNLTSGKLPTPK